MFVIIATDRKFVEHLVRREETEKKAQQACQDFLKTHSCRPFDIDLLRVHYRPIVSILERDFYETEAQVIQVAIDSLKRKFPLTPTNLVCHVSEFLVHCLEEESLPWADPDMVATAISKLSNLSGSKLQEIIDENS